MTRALVVVLGLAVVAAGCTKTLAKTPTQPPPPPAPLNVPTPPPVVLTPVNVEPVEMPPPTEPVVIAPKPTATQIAKPPVQTASPPPTPPPNPVTDVPPPVLQTTRSAEAQRIKAQSEIALTQQLLASVNRSRLSPEAQLTLNDAERFLRSAREAIEKKDFEGAARDANKALIFAQALVKGTSVTPTSF